MRKREKVVSGDTVKVVTGCGNMYVTFNRDNEGPVEIFVSLGKSGGCKQTMLEGIGRLVSLCFRSNVGIDEIIDQLQALRFPQPTIVDVKSLSCPDGVAKALDYFRKNKLKHVKNEEVVEEKK